ncbi:hypothetical protein TNCV_3461071 [Trichonephila clavipes]|nr:hypothetical protein TNCV_3461071 [Trichonephila clavipes]
MATSTNKTAAFGVKLIHKCMSKHRYRKIQKIIGLYFFKNDEATTSCGSMTRRRNMSHSSCHNRFIERHSLVYADKPQTLDHLEDNIRRVIADIRPQMLEKVIENWTSRLDYIRASRGSPMPEIIFKM